MGIDEEADLSTENKTYGDIKPTTTSKPIMEQANIAERNSSAPANLTLGIHGTDSYGRCFENNHFNIFSEV